MLTEIHQNYQLSILSSPSCSSQATLILEKPLSYVTVDSVTKPISLKVCEHSKERPLFLFFRKACSYREA